MMPEEVLKAARELNAKKLLAVHSSKFAIANHAWDEPLSGITELNKNFGIPLITPMIGEEVYLKDDSQVFTEWWKGIN
jgi:L-ascorbate metabolism protein UlaG (beta-lactamase superfamily)